MDICINMRVQQQHTVTRPEDILPICAILLMGLTNENTLTRSETMFPSTYFVTIHLLSFVNRFREKQDEVFL